MKKTLLWLLLASTNTLFGGNGTVMLVAQDVFDELLEAYYAETTVSIDSCQDCSVIAVLEEPKGSKSVILTTQEGESFWVSSQPADNVEIDG